MGSFNKYLLGFWALFLGGLLLLTLFFQLLSADMLYKISGNEFWKLPTFEELENPQSNLASEVYATDGEMLGKFYQQNRSNIEYEDLPQCLIDALISTEDERFYEHAGIDFEALARVVKGILTFNLQGGGSTISQQLAKNLFPRGRHGKFGLVIRKFQEWVIAVRLERAYTKEEILTMYFNTVPFSQNAYGIKSAARTYFNKSVDSLSLQESAVFVGMLRATTRYNPIRNPGNAMHIRDVVMKKMVDNEKLAEAVYDSVKLDSVYTDYTPSTHIEGLAPYFREYLRQEVKKWAAENPKADGSNYDIYKDGLRIYTTIDSRLQEYAEMAVEKHLLGFQETFFDHWKKKDPWKDFPSEWERLINTNSSVRAMKDSGLSDDSIKTILSTERPMKIFDWDSGEIDTVMSFVDSLRYHRMHLQTGFLALDPKDGSIKAWVGGINYKYFQFDHVHSRRQIGSTFKPFVYAKAILDAGISPCRRYPLEQVTFEKSNPKWERFLSEDWTPKNSDGKYEGMMTIKKGLANSVNTITARMMMEVGPPAVIEFVRKLGIEAPIDSVPSICLGTPDISLYEMLGAYTVFANYGTYSKPYFLDRIEDKNGNLIAEFGPDRRIVMTDKDAYIIVDLLRNVIRQGTGLGVHRYVGWGHDIGGKTGTTQKHSDGWFIGITPNLIAGSWVGCEDRFVRYRSMRWGQGARMAMPIWGHFFEKVYADSMLDLDMSATFEQPGELEFELDCSKYAKPDSVPVRYDDDGFFGY